MKLYKYLKLELIIWKFKKIINKYVLRVSSSRKMSENFIFVKNEIIVNIKSIILFSSYYTYQR